MNHSLKELEENYLPDGRPVEPVCLTWSDDLEAAREPQSRVVRDVTMILFGMALALAFILTVEGWWPK